MKVKKLSESVINRIAAGEVVERPYSVVRELVENSLDAGATEIHVLVEEGGQNLIQIVDNGCGMSPDDAARSLERHATSKIVEAEDLDHLQTLGFRGEALAAIAAVSKLSLTTRSSDDAVGIRLYISGGELLETQAIAAPIGTRIEVRNLFFNTPARKKFLRTNRTEEERIGQWLTASALAHHSVRFKYTCNGKERFLYDKHDDIVTRSRRVFGENVLGINYSEGQYSVSGAVLPPERASYDPQKFFILVGGRVVSDKMLLRAAREGMVGMLADRAFPVGVMRIEVPPEQVDVNVHPQKSEVRFVDTKKIFLVARRAIALAIEGLLAPLEVNLPGETRSVAYTAPKLAFSNQSLITQQVAPQLQLNIGDSPNSALNIAPSSSINSPRLTDTSELRVLGIVLETFVVIERSEAVLLLDFHAAHERINFNRIYESLRARTHSAQRLLVPLVVELGSAGLLNWEESSGLLRESGFDFEAFGENSVVIREAPSWIDPSSLEKLVKEIASADIADGPLDARMRALAARMACHSSVRAGDFLSSAAIQALLTELDAANSSGLCPHGRPVIVELSRSELHNWFGR